MVISILTYIMSSMVIYILPSMVTAIMTAIVTQFGPQSYGFVESN